MKYLIIIIITVINLSCKSQIELKKNSFKNNVEEIELNIIEKEILNEFLVLELQKELYKKYKNLEIFIIEEALKKSQAIDTYIYSLTDWNSMNKIKKSEDIDNLYFINNIQINKIKKEVTTERQYLWKESDFKVIKTKMLKYQELTRMINSRYKEVLPMKPIIYLSRPLIIDDNNALISFEIGNFQGVYNSTTHFTILMRKINNKWIANGYYEDGVY